MVSVAIEEAQNELAHVQSMSSRRTRHDEASWQRNARRCRPVESSWPAPVATRFGKLDVAHPPSPARPRPNGIGVTDPGDEDQCRLGHTQTGPRGFVP